MYKFDLTNLDMKHLKLKQEKVEYKEYGEQPIKERSQSKNMVVLYNNGVKTM